MNYFSLYILVPFLFISFLTLLFLFIKGKLFDLLGTLLLILVVWYWRRIWISQDLVSSFMVKILYQMKCRVLSRLKITWLIWGFCFVTCSLSKFRKRGKEWLGLFRSEGHFFYAFLKQNKNYICKQRFTTSQNGAGSNSFSILKGDIGWLTEMNFDLSIFHETSMLRLVGDQKIDQTL